ncbi:MAG TPA: BON domain-containing protein [Terriglobales bacterium]|nr:BON domain-containing protein [Terriglobales bacterium]
MRWSFLVAAVMVLALVGLGCSQRSNVSYKDSVKSALEQAELKDVTVSEDRDKNTITLGGTVHSEDAKNRAGDLAKSVANTRVIANEISVQPVGVESQAKDIASDVDGGIEKNYKAVLLANGLDKQHIRFDSKNAVVTLKGTVKTSQQREEAQKLASTVPNVQQVVNEIELRR